MSDNDIVLVGFGGHAKAVIDAIEKKNIYHIIGFTEKTEAVKQSYKGYSVIGSDDMLEAVFRSGVKNAFVTVGCIGDAKIRISLYKRLIQIGFTLPVIIDATAAVADNVRIGGGTYVGKNAVINADTVIGSMCIVNDGAIVEHDCNVSDFVHAAVGSVICGGAAIGEATFIGANATLIQGLSIGKNVKIGAGTVVLKDVPDDCTALGIWKAGLEC